MIEVTIYNMIGVVLGSIFFTHFYTPIQPIKNRLLDKLPDTWLGNSCHTIFTCPKCLSFIISIIIFWDLIAAFLCSIVAYFINHLIDRVEQWYE